MYQRDRHPHAPSVGFAEVNVSKYPELGLDGMKQEDLPLQLVVGAGQMRHIGIDILSDEHSESETAEFYAKMVQ